jgi:WD40 repeat protein
MVEVILQEGDHFITAGADGYIKWFKVADVDVAEAEEGIEVELVPVKELLIAENEEGKNPAHIVNMVSAGKKWYVQDGRGKIYVVSKETDMYSEIYRFTEGAIMDLVASPAHHYAISLGESGQVKVWDYAKKEPFTEKMFLGRGTCLSHLPQTDANKGRLFAAGFDNGIVRFMNVNTDGLEIMKAFKAHANAIVGVRYSQDLKICVTADVSGDVFFYEMDGHKDVQ